MGPESSGRQAQRLIVTCRTTLDATLRLFVPVVWLMMLLQYFYLIHYCFLFNKILICSIHLTRLKYYGHKHQQDLKINTVYHIIVSICRVFLSSFAICACCKSFLLWLLGIILSCRSTVNLESSIIGFCLLNSRTYRISWKFVSQNCHFGIWLILHCWTSLLSKIDRE